MAAAISPRTARRYLRDLKDPQTRFRTLDGKTLKNLVDLTCYLKACPDEAFRYHVGRDHNHFSKWVEHAILDKELADQLSLLLERNPMRIVTAKRVNLLVHSATRELSPKEKAMVVLADAVLPEEHFLTNDGRTLRNLWELQGFLESADDDTVSYHASPLNNDFSDWVGGVLTDHELARRLRAARSREEMLLLVSSRISNLEAFGVRHGRGWEISSYAKSIKGL